MKSTGFPARLAAALAVLLLGAAGCYPTWGPLARLGRYNGSLPIKESPPRLRIGSLPYPLPLVPLEAIDPLDLGTHRYETGFLATWPGETSRGIIYTQRGGFIDIAHVRNAADLTRYAYLHIHEALRQEAPGLILVSAEPSLFQLMLNYDARAWPDLTISERTGAERELAIRLAQRVALQMSTWHEFITWYGYQALPLISEKHSAFSYDDAPSHMLGIVVAAAALRQASAEHEDEEAAYEEAFTAALAAEIERLKPVDADTARKLVDLVKDDWWDGSSQRLRKRLVQTATEGEVLRPWIVAEEPDAAGEAGEIFGPHVVQWRLPSLRNVYGRDCSRIARLTIDPNIWEGDRIREDLELPEGDLVPQRDFPRLAAIIQAHEQERDAALDAGAEDAESPAAESY